ncbi:TRAP transporter large permease subunit [Vibrio zhugei]|uniref:TRAP transporter large permease protein n=1 Tax=Vibrio zhugei TaxID=2479546 RepID=A0ABV7CDA8_9VIBR|nr:TRAP transporter large permease subunit [Vibrio zhugei]
MGIETLTLVLLACIMVAFILGAQVGMALGGIAMGVGYLSWGDAVFNIVPSTVESTFFNFTLLAIPLYIYMGQLLTRSGIGDAMFNASQLAIGKLRGSLAISVIGVCSMIGAMVGIIGAGIMTSSSIALKPMMDRGYDKKLALGVIMAGGSLGILIPPSIPMIMFASATQSSVGKMFLGAMVPALITIVLLISYVIISCRLRPERAPLDQDNDFEMPKGVEVMRTIRDGASSLALIVVVLGSIIMGVATPTESGALGVMGALLLAILFKRFKPEMVARASKQTAVLVSVAMWIMVGASVFSNFHLLMGVQGMVSQFAAGLDMPPIVIIMMFQVIMILLGFIIDEYIIVLMCAPIFTPVAVSLGYDPIWFGVLMILNIVIAVQTPPYGFALFYLKGIAPKGVTMMDLYKAVLPFISIQVLVLMIVMCFPQLVTWLPNLVMSP